MSGETSPAAASLRANARPFLPQPGGIRPIKTSPYQKDVYAEFDAVPFTPSQGICTPSPTNVAALWMRHPFHPAGFAPYEYVHAWNAMTANYGPPGPASASSSGTDSPGAGGYASGGPFAGQPGTPPYGSAPPYYSSVFFFPMPISPTAVQLAAAHGGDPGSPAHGGSPGGGAFMHGGYASSPGFVGSPASPHGLVPMRPMPFPHHHHYYEGGPEGGPHHQQQQQQHEAAGAAHATPGSKSRRKQRQAAAQPLALPVSPPDGGKGTSSASSSDGLTSDGSAGIIEVTAAALALAAAVCAAHALQGEPPQQLVELTSLLQLYGLVPAQGGGGEGSGSSSPSVADKGKRQKSQTRVNADGSVRLNARQRRTLRRAQERAMRALAEMQHAQRGIDADEAAANVSAMHPTFFGSPPVAAGSPMNHISAAVPPPPAFMAPMMAAGPFPGSPGYGYYHGGSAMPQPMPLMPMGQQQQQQPGAPWQAKGGSPPGSGGRRKGAAPRASRFRTQNEAADQS